MPDNTQPQPAALLSRVTKSKSIRIKLEGDDFLDFHNISGRIVFPEKLSERALDEALVKIALRRLKSEIEFRLNNGEQFISANSL